MAWINPSDWCSVIIDTNLFEIWVSTGPPPDQNSTQISYQFREEALFANRELSPKPKALQSHEHQLFIRKDKREAFINTCLGQSRVSVDGVSWISECRKQHSVLDPLGVWNANVMWTRAARHRLWTAIRNLSQWTKFIKLVAEEAIQCACKIILERKVLLLDQNTESSGKLLDTAADETIHFAIKDVALKYAPTDRIMRQWPRCLAWTCDVIMRELGADLCVWVRTAHLDIVSGLTVGSKELIVFIVQFVLYMFTERVRLKASGTRERSMLTIFFEAVFYSLLGIGINWLLNLVAGSGP